jgi:hypothetical protein
MQAKEAELTLFDREFPGDVFAFGLNLVVIQFLFRWETVVSKASFHTSTWSTSRKDSYSSRETVCQINRQHKEITMATRRK